jgi:hypothetical protein
LLLTVTASIVLVCSALAATTSSADAPALGRNVVRPAGATVDGTRARALTRPQHAVQGKTSLSPSAMTVSPTLAQAHATDPVDMKLLVISADGNETDFPALKSFLDQLGIPYDTLIATQTPLTAATLWDGGVHGYYQGVILTTGNLTYLNPATQQWESAFSQDEWNTLWSYEAMFGVRQVTSYTYPAGWPDDYGLNLVTYQDTTLAPLQATLTPAGRQVFPYLKASSAITIRNAWTYLANVNSPAVTTPLLVTADGYAIASVHTYPDGRENLAVTAANAPFLTHSMLLSYGIVNWVTKGFFLGERHVYMSPQVDDLLIDDDVWDATALSDTTGRTYRMTGNDFLATLAWQGNVRAGYPTTPPAQTCVTLQPAASTGKDAYLKSEKKDENTGNNVLLMTDSETKAKGPLRSLIQFDLSGIPVGATVSSASVGLYLSRSGGSQTDVVEAHRLTRNWVEGTGASKSGVTWNSYDGLNRWSTPGGDFDPAVAGSFVASGTGWKTLSLTSLAQAWVNGSAPNYGVVLLSPPAAGNNQKEYPSSDNGNASLRPKLDVCYRPLPAPAGNSSTFTLEMAFNAEGASGIFTPDTLTPVVRKNQSLFRWVNHTWSHLSLDAPTTYQQSTAELTQNHNAAVSDFGFTSYVKDAMVQPDISGLANPEFQRAAKDFGIASMISDTSRPGWANPTPNAGFWSVYQPSILIIPRRPTNLFYNLTTPEEWVSEYNCYYGPTGTCAGGAWRFWDHDLSYAEILDKESDAWLTYLLKWDIDPLMFHQPNLRAYDGTHSLLSDLTDAVLAKYNRMVDLPIRSISQHEIGIRMAQRMAYNASGVRGSLVPCQSITLTASKPVLVPLTGVSTGANRDTYGGQTISYVQLNANEPVTVPAPACP